MAYYLKKCIYNSPILEDGTVVYRSEWYDTKWTTHLEDKTEYATFTMFCKNKMSLEDRQKFKLKMLHRYEDALEVRLAGIKAAKEKLEEQMNRDGNQ
jgi:hypothetical protein